MSDLKYLLSSVDSGIRSRVKRWSPWHLRKALDLVGLWLNDERNQGYADHLDTSTEVMFRFVVNALAGMPVGESADDAKRFSVVDGTLHIKIKADH